jgi:membrane associated rhomboid family serine protease
VSSELSDGEVRAFDFRRRARAIVLDDDGVHHPVTARGRGQVFTPYSEITHLAVSPQCLWLGSRRSAYALSRGAFVDPLGPERLLRALLERIAARPGGGAQLARINELDARGAETPPTRATFGLALICIAVYAFEALTDVPVFDAGYMSLALVRDGDLHRIVTANLIHAFSVHLAFNLLCLLAVGRMLERAIGTERVVCVMGASALGAMLATGWLRDASVVGVSGVVFGLAAGLLWVELRCAEALPAWWRFPRRALLWICGALLLDSALGFVIPIVAGEAHLGGFAAGLLATATVTPRSLAPASLAVQRASRAVVATTAVAVLAAVVMLAVPGEFRVRHALRVAQLPGVSAEELNNRAWQLATLRNAKPEELAVALMLAQRAVEATQRRDATILDTLAEVQFQLGHPESAIAIIDEAIAREPDEAYYREQRRRFLGERARDDRPDPPLPDSPWSPSPEPDEPPEGDPGITV